MQRFANSRSNLSEASILVILAAATAAHGQCGPSYARTGDYAMGTSTSFVVMADVNGDGRLDMLATNNDAVTPSVAVRLGTSNGTFGSATNFPSGTSSIYFAVADMNGDGKLDLIVNGFGLATLNILLGNGNGTFGAAIPAPAASNGRQVAIGDVNGDGKLDVVSAAQSSTVLRVFLGNGDGTLGAATTYTIGSTLNGVVLSDFNNDGVLDIACSRGGTGGTWTLRGNAGGTFQTPVNIAGSGGGYITCVDLNNDGFEDLLVDNSGLATIYMQLGNANGTFQAQTGLTVSPSAMSTYQIGVADLNNDGIRDLVVPITNADVIAVRLGVGNGTFSSPIEYPVGETPVTVAIGDINRDGKRDIVSANTASGNITVLTAHTGPEIITQPQDLHITQGDVGSLSVVAANAVTYRWRRNGVNLNEGPQYAGTATDTLNVTGSAIGDAGAFDCLITACDSISATTVLAHVMVMCRADFNMDSGVDFFDYLDFVDAFSASNGAADFNKDGGIDFFDYLDFVDAFSAGC